MIISESTILLLNFLLSLIAIGISIITAIKAHRISRENTNLANASIELEIRNMISVARLHLSDVSVKLLPILDKKNDGKLSEDEKSICEAFEKQYSEARQNLINSYEEACTKYLDGKIDKVRFKKNYIIEIRNIVEAKELKGLFDSHSSRYKAIIKVYDEWENLEK